MSLKEKVEAYISNRPDDDLDVALMNQLTLKIEDLKVVIAQAYDIVDIELLPNAATMAIQDFGRLNQFMMSASPIKKEIDG